MLKQFITDELPLAFFWLLLGLLCGLIYSVEMVGIEWIQNLLSPDRARSLHISLMLYGFFPLFLSLLPFALFEKEGMLSEKGVAYLRRYFWVWNVFLLFMTMALLFGNMRGLPFYDFPYPLNFLLAFGGVFYLLALIDALRRYEKRPLWVNVSLLVVVVAPAMLVLLMNPEYGQVEKSLVGPHGDNTLGMSFALIPLYYLLIKLAAPGAFIPRWHLLWAIPLIGYVVSLVIRNFFHPLSYGEEWFFQYLTLLYLPLLWRWWKDSKLTFNRSPYLLLSMGAFAFVDLEGNVLFIPQIRELIHRNDLVVGHAHIAMGIAVAFMALSIVHRMVPGVMTKACAVGWATLVSLMALSLSAAGMIEAGWLGGSVETFLIGRSLFGAVLIVMVGMIFVRRLGISPKTPIEWYHWIGVASDLGGGIVLLVAGEKLFALAGFEFAGGIQYAVFAFMIGTGLVHWYGTRQHPYMMASLSALIRLVVAAAFISLYWAGTIGPIALLVGVYDGAYALLYGLWLKEKGSHRA